MFPLDEKQEICDKMRVLDRQRDKSKQTDGSPVALFNLFIQRCRDQLHIVLAMSPIGDAFRNRLRKFPSLVNCCTIDWFQVEILFLYKFMTHPIFDRVLFAKSLGLKMPWKQWRPRPLKKSISARQISRDASNRANTFTSPLSSSPTSFRCN